MLEVVEFEVEGALAVESRLRGEKSLNLVDDVILRRAGETLRTVLARPDLRCVVLTGSDTRAFVGGANLEVLGSLDARRAEPFIRAIHEFCNVLREAPVPVIARLQGYCLGAGLEIAAACDIRVGDTSVRCGMPEVRVGVPSVVEAALLPGLIGWGKTRELLLRGHIIDAEESARVGILQALTPPQALEETLQSVLRDIVAGAPQAIAAQKRLFRQWEESGVDGAIEHGVTAFVEAYRGDEPRRYAEAFFAARARRGRDD